MDTVYTNHVVAVGVILLLMTSWYPEKSTDAAR
jgi:hypothetical protein